VVDIKPYEKLAYASYYQRQSIVERVIQKPVVANNEIIQREKQIECLADNIYHESKGETYSGKISVGFVTIHRTSNESFPDNICGVVKQRTKGTCQFSWYCDKKKKKESQKKLVVKVSDSDYYDIKNLAENLYVNHDKIHDPTKGALYFHAKYVKVKRKGKVVKAKVDNHIFYDVKTKKP
jgi:spore germination cell wall hydrolase CwlJ-like protein